MKKIIFFILSFLTLSVSLYCQKPVHVLPVNVLKMDPNDFSNAPLATQAEIDEFNNVINNQNGVGVLGGDNTRPFYYHANQPNEAVYKYKKLIDASKLPSSGLEVLKNLVKSKVPYVGNGLSWVVAGAGDVVGYVENLGEAALDFFTGDSKDTYVWVDCWYPDSEKKRTVCGKADEVHMCSQDYLHTKLTVDKDFNIDIKPDNNFLWSLNNRWLGSSEQKKTLEAEVKLKNLVDYNTRTKTSSETINPHNPLLLKIPVGTDVCLYGPWMADILDINAKVPIPFTDDHIDLGKIDLNTNNEIHPLNQLWYKKGDETDLIAMSDGNKNYFDKTGNNEIEASGLNHPMRFYIAFQFPAKAVNTVVNSGNTTAEYDINGVAFDVTDHPEDVKAETLSLTYNGVVRIKVNDNSFVRIQKTHTLLFDKVRKRADGSVQGYIVVETVPIVKGGGSINITVNKKAQQSGVITPSGARQ